MKRLVDQDDPGDDVLRLLIRAGANHQPSPTSKMRVMAALGLGSAVGLSASKVLAWLGTSSGKVALSATVIGVAAAGTFALTSRTVAEVTSQPLAATPVGRMPGGSQPSAPTPVEWRAVRGDSQRAATAPAAVEPRLGQPALASDLDATAALVPLPERRTPPRALTSPRGRSPSAAPRSDGDTPEIQAGLAVETAWVDQLRLAAEGQDRQAFERLLGQYSQRFPQGQLHPEVNRLRASLR
jgi:hypothetical protein